MQEDINELAAQMRLAEIINDTPKSLTLGGEIYYIKPLRAGTQWLVAQEACKIAKDGESFSDIIKQFASSITSVVRVLCLIILNDKDKIDGDEYTALYEKILWEVPRDEWISVLVECLQMLQLDSFFVITDVIDNFRKMTLTRKNQEAK